MIETIIQNEKINDFFHNTIKCSLIERYSIQQIFESTNKRNSISFYLFEIQENEFRKSNTMFYSRSLKYRYLGLLENNIFPYSLIYSIQCSKCFNKMETYDICGLCKRICKEEQYPYFININQIIGSNEYNKIKTKYNLGFDSEIYRDQKNTMCIPMKQEILANALHPDRIERILDITKCHFTDLDKYI